MRTFIALDISDEIRERMSSFAYDIAKSQKKGLKCVEPENLHLTVKFIGEYPDTRLDVLLKILEEIHAAKIQLSFHGAGGFPLKSVHPRVLWVAPQMDENLLRLHDAIDRRLVDVGIARDDKPYHPHLTLARLKEDASPECVEILKKNSDTFFGKCPVDSFHLYESVLKTGGPVYSKIRSFSLL
jgi:RNA 2',3'-cyclic 3'-phosphodiesterase